MFPKKRLAYLFLAICFIIFGYFIYDTFVLMKSGKDDIAKEVEKEDQKKTEKTSVEIVYKDYSIDLKATYAVYKDGRIYLYNNPQICDIELINSSLVAFLDVENTESSSAKSASIIADPLSSRGLTISGIPDTTNEINLEKSETGLKGDLNLVWTNRLMKGHFEAEECVSSL